MAFLEIPNPQINDLLGVPLLRNHSFSFRGKEVILFPHSFKFYHSIIEKKNGQKEHLKVIQRWDRARTDRASKIPLDFTWLGCRGRATHSTVV